MKGSSLGKGLEVHIHPMKLHRIRERKGLVMLQLSVVAIGEYCCDQSDCTLHGLHPLPWSSKYCITEC